MPQSNQNWLVPTLAGALLASLRAFRRNPAESKRRVLIRFFVHVSTCIFAGYVMGGLLEHFQQPGLIPPGCALAGLYGRALVEWAEEDGLKLLIEYLRGRTASGCSRPSYPDDEGGR